MSISTRSVVGPQMNAFRRLAKSGRRVPIRDKRASPARRAVGELLESARRTVRDLRMQVERDITFADRQWHDVDRVAVDACGRWKCWPKRNGRRHRRCDATDGGHPSSTQVTRQLMRMTSRGQGSEPGDVGQLAG